ncbi:MAG: hypothetical protein AAGD06_27750 [Acidobacteriota bacterium]
MTPLRSLLWAKGRVAVHTLASVQRESKLKVAFVSLSAAAMLVGIFQLSRLGFGLFETFGAELLAGGRLSLGDLVMARLLSMLALTVFVLLTFSNVLIAYATLYRAREMPFLVQSPISVTSLFLGRFVECVSFSSWASAFLGAPVMLAYGLESGAPPLFYAALAAFYVPFVVIPAAVGSIVAMAMVRLLVQLEHRATAFGGAGVGLLVALFSIFRGRVDAPDLSDPTALQGVLEVLGRTQSPFLPSQWLAGGVLAAATGDASEALFQFLLLASTALLLLWLATLAADAWLHRGFSALLAADERRQGGTGVGILGRLEGFLRPVPEPTRSLIVKDLRLFWREPVQWSQFLLLFGVMALYLANLGRTPPASLDAATWQAWGTLLNLSACMLILASLTTRFVYPLISLEGRRFWILGLAPVTRRQVLRQKFWLSVTTTAVFTLGLALLSAWRLGLGPLPFTLSLASVAATTLALSGLAVGLGALYPNFEEDNPSRVVSGLGGTLCFLLSLLYILLVTAALAVVLLWHDVEAHLGGEALPWVVAAVGCWIAVLTAVTGAVPLRLGLRHLERVEV